MHEMTKRERFQAVMNFQPFDRLPMIEWAPFWTLTVERWRSEGLPKDCDPYKHFGLEFYPRDWVCGRSMDVPQPESHGAGIIKDMDDYLRIKDQYLYPWPIIGHDVYVDMAQQQARGDIALWFSMESYFWYPRALLGIERHLMAFYDQPELMHRINSDLVEYHLKYIDKICSYSIPDFMTFAEDMNYKNGCMISKALFDEFMMPYYNKSVQRLNEYGVIPMIDSDGDVTESAHWFEEAGIRGVLPIERQAGNDINQLRSEHPEMVFIGHFDKLIMHKGEAALRAEFERLLPAASNGGFIPSVDHQTPPNVSLDDYTLYIRLFREYAAEAGRLSQCK